MNRQKLSILDIELANKDLLEATAKQTKTTEGEVSDIINYVGRFIASKIREGGMSSVRIPYFGVFKPKDKMIKALSLKNRNQRSGVDIVNRALSGKALLDYRPKQLRDNDETI